MKIIKKIYRDAQFIRDIKNFRDLPYVCKIAKSHGEVMSARRLQARVYLEKGNIRKDQITKDGVLDEKTDSYYNQSTYFIVKDLRHKSSGVVLAASRQINHIEGMGFDAFQIFKKVKIDDAGKNFVSRFDPERTVEISGLVKKRGQPLILPMYLYRQMWRYSVQRNHHLWIMVITDHLYYRLKHMFGSVIREIGPKQALPHSNNFVVPSALEINRVMDILQAERESGGYVQKAIVNKVLDFFLKQP